MKTEPAKTYQQARRVGPSTAAGGFELALLALVVSGCGPLEDVLPRLGERGKDPAHAAPRRGPPDAVFSRDRVLSVKLSLDDADWQRLRYEDKSLFDTFPASEADLAPFPYTTFPARARVDGVDYGSVGLRKAGFLGGRSIFVPELEIDFGLGRPVRSGLRTMTFSNNLEDASWIRECLAFDLFAAADYPAPRCNFARVHVNGQDLGPYVHVEAIDEHMLARHFSDASGDLYQGNTADIFANTLPLIQNQNQPPRRDRAGLSALLAALEVEGEDFVPALSEVLDIESFRDFWALETLLGHWDGYSNSANSYYLYEDPESGRFVFLPWDTDQAFVGAVPFGPPYEITVYYAGRIANRLYADPDQREQFRERLGQLNDTLWNEADLLARAEALAAVMPSDSAALDSLREYLRTHGRELREGLQLPAPEVAPAQPFSVPPGDECQFLLTPISGSFDTQLSAGPYEPSATRGTGTLEAFPDGRRLEGEIFAFAGQNPIIPGSQSVFVGAELADGSFLGFTLIIPDKVFDEGTYPFHALETFAPAISMNPFDEPSIATFGFVSEGAIELENVGSELGDPVTGSFHGQLYQLTCTPPQ